MNIGGEPGRDDYGLPPVDVEIPDDARALERDVQAYHRELRAQRRRVLARRLCAPLTRDGMVLPLLAGCLALTLLAGTLLTVFTAGQRMAGVPRPGSNQPRASAPASLPPAGQPGSSLPEATVVVNGEQSSLRALIATGPALLLALVPASCQCTRNLRQLVSEAKAAGAQPYLVGGQESRMLALSKQVGLGSSHAVADSEHMLPPGYHPSVLTALLVDTNGRVIGRVPATAATTGWLKAELKPLAAPASPATGSLGTPKAATATAGPKLSTPTS